MNLKSVLPITRRKVTNIPVKNMVIKAMVNMTEDNKITTFKFENKAVVLLNPTYWLAGVDHEDKNANEIEDRNYDGKKFTQR